MIRAASLALVLALFGAGCSEQGAAPPKQSGKAAGEVAGGSITDAMIPLEQLESQAPLAPRPPLSSADLDAQQPEISGELAPTNEGAEVPPATPSPEAQPAE